MKVSNSINPNSAQGLNRADQSRAMDKSNDTEQAKKAHKKDDSVRVDLSDRAKEISRVKEALSSLDEIDEAKVAKFQELIDTGKYSVNSEAVADRMVDEHLKAN